MAIPQSTQTTDYLTVRKGITINGIMTFGDASVDTMTVNGAATFASTVAVTGALDVNNTVDVDATSTTNVVDVVNAGTGDVMKISNSATNAAATKALLELENTSTAAGAASQGLVIDMNGTGAAGGCIVIDDEATGNTAAISVASARTGIIASIAAEGAATSVLTLTAANGVDANPTLTIDNNETNGVSKGLKIDLISTGASFAFEVTAVGTNVGPIFTDSVATDTAIDNVKAVIRITNGTTTYYLPCLDTYT